MPTKRLRLIHLHRCRGMTRRILRRILQVDPHLLHIFQLSSSQLSQFLSIRNNQAERLYQDLHNDSVINELYQDIKQYQIITMFDETYPAMLKTIKDAPIILYALGDTTLLKQFPSISVIGSRKPSPHAGIKINMMIKPLIMEQWIIISGMAKGIDSYAHQLTLRLRGKTIAVLGSGFHHIYPKENRLLFSMIQQNGLLLSEYPPNTPPQKYHFPERNRIISGLSFATVVIEATEKSGTMITVDQALDQGREVYAVPDAPHIPQSQGCLKLIQEGAKLLLSPEDIKHDWEVLGKNWHELLYLSNNLSV